MTRAWQRVDAPFDNLGYWRFASDHQSACRALAIRLGEAADLGPGQRMVEVGVGRGASLTLWRDRFGVSRVIALEPDPRRASIAARQPGSARVFCAPAHRLGAVVAGRVDAVLALDCAYHFAHLGSFLAAARRCLKPGGRLVLSDLVVPRSTLALRLAARACGIVPANLAATSEHKRRLREAGFVRVRVESLEPFVLQGFASWASTQPGGLPLKYRATAWLVQRLRGQVSYAMISASAPG